MVLRRVKKMLTSFNIIANNEPRNSITSLQDEVSDAAGQHCTQLETELELTREKGTRLEQTYGAVTLQRMVPAYASV